MKANRAQIERGLAHPADTRLFLLHGPDEAGSRALARKLAAAMGGETERIDLTGAELKADPARLADEAAAISMFGGARWILVEQAGDECTAAAEALIESKRPGWRNAKHAAQWGSTLATYAYPQIGDLDAKAVGTAEVLA